MVRPGPTAPAPPVLIADVAELCRSDRYFAPGVMMARTSAMMSGGVA
jgi:hypothetical protein